MSWRSLRRWAFDTRRCLALYCGCRPRGTPRQWPCARVSQDLDSGAGVSVWPEGLGLPFLPKEPAPSHDHSKWLRDRELGQERGHILRCTAGFQQAGVDSQNDEAIFVRPRGRRLGAVTDDTDDLSPQSEDGDGENGARSVSKMLDPRLPSQREVDQHRMNHLPFRS